MMNEQIVNEQRMLNLRKQLPQVLKNLNKQLGLPEDSGLLGIIMNTAEGLWETLDHCNNYQRNIETGHVRNKTSHKVLVPNNSGWVKVKTTEGNWTQVKLSR